MAEMDEKAARVRSLLSSYYGAQESSPAESPISQASSRDVPARQPRSIGLDSTTFDSTRYINQLLASTRMQPLLQKQVEMSSEIKGLNSDMQMLVYENYNKFISATDTIRSMKCSVEEMDSKMLALKNLIGGVAETSRQVNGKLQQRQGQMEDLSDVRELLIKLQAVFQLPKQLRAAIDQGAIEIAADKYADVAGILKHYGHKGAFRRVNTEVQACARAATAVLKRRLAGGEGDTVECISLLRKFGEPVERLQDAYLEQFKGRINQILTEAETLAKRMDGAGDQGEVEIWGIARAQPIGLSTFVVELDQRFIAQLASSAASYAGLFAEDGRPAMVQVAKEAFGRYLHILRQRLHHIATQRARETATSDSLADPPSESPDESPEKDWGTGDLASALASFATDVSRLQNLLPEISAKDRGAEVVEKAVRFHVGECFSQLEARLFRDLAVVASSLPPPATSATGRIDLSEAKALKERSSHELIVTAQKLWHLLGATAREGDQPNLPQYDLSTTPDEHQGNHGPLHAAPVSLDYTVQGFGAALGVVDQGTASILRAVRGYQQQSVILRSWQDVFVDLVQGQLQHLFLSLLQGLLQTGQGEPKDAVKVPQHGFVLLLARLADAMEGESVAGVLELVAAGFAGQGVGAGGDQPPAFVAGDVARRLGVGAQSLLEGYVKLQGATLADDLAPSLQFDATSSGSKVEGRRAHLNDLLQRLSEAEVHISHLVRERKNMPTSPYGRQEEAGNPGSSTALERNVARLFNRRTPTFSKVTFSQRSIMGGLVRGALKSFVEDIRLLVLEKTSLQQLQFDIYTLRQTLPRFLVGSELNTMHILLDEALAAATERCHEPVLLDPAVLEKTLTA